MNDRLILRTVDGPFLVPYNDITKGNVLSHTELDNNFLYLKGNIIYTAQTSGNIVTLKKINGDEFSFNVGSSGGGGGTDAYWTSGSTGTYAIKANNDSNLDSTGLYSVAEGFATLASGDASHAEGHVTQATNTGSHAEGDSTLAGGAASHAEGQNTTASNNGSHAEGYYTSAGGNYAHAEGGKTIADGKSSHAGGDATSGYVIADGDASFTHQYVDGEGQFGVGSYGTYALASAILGGTNHYIQAGSYAGAIMGGVNHLLYGNSATSGIFAGNSNLLINTEDGVVLGGNASGTINADASAIVGGYDNLIDAFAYNSAPYAFIGGGFSNKIQTGGGATDESSAIIGGSGNLIEGDNQYNGIYNSFNSTLTSQDTSTIIGSYASYIYDNTGGLSSHNNTIINATESGINGFGMAHANILGGSSNSIGQFVDGVNTPNYTTIINGYSNTINDSDTATIINGYANQISSASKQSTIINGQYNTITSSQFAAIIGGNSGEMTDSDGSAIIGGSNNGILSDGNPAFTRYYNAILGGTGNTIDNGELSFIMGGYQNLIPYGTVGSVILGGDSITATSNNTVFVQRLNIKYAQNDNLTTKILTIDNNGLVKYRDVSSISGGTGGSGGSGGTTIDLYWASGTTGSFSIKANNGSTTDATANYALAEGFNTLASGLYSHAEGNGTESRAQSSHAQNQGTLARGNYSHAGGYNSTASGNTSFVHSYQSTASGDRSAVIGGIAINGSANDTVYVPFLNIQSATTDNALSTILARSSDGSIKLKSLSSGVLFGSITATSITTTGMTAVNANITNLTGTSANLTNITANTVTTNTISATTYLNLPLSITGFSNNAITYTGSSGTISFVTNNGSVITLTGLTDTRVTGFTYDNKNTLTIGQSNLADKTVNVSVMSGLTVNGNITFTGQSNNPIYSAGSGAFTGVQTEITLDFNKSSIQTVVLTGTTKFNTPLNIKDGAIYTLILKQNSVGGNNVNWFTPTFKWEYGTLPAITTTANAVDLITFISDGTTLYGIIAKNFS